MLAIASLATQATTKYATVRAPYQMCDRMIAVMFTQLARNVVFETLLFGLQNRTF